MYTSEQQEKEGASKNLLLVEVGPRLSFESAISSNAKSICRASGIDGVTRLEVGARQARLWCEAPWGLAVYAPMHERRAAIID